MNSRTHILQNIRRALENKSYVTDNRENVDDVLNEKREKQKPASLKELVELFKRELEAVSGEFVRVVSEQQAAVHIEKIVRDQSENRLTVAGMGLADSVLAHVQDKMSIVRPKDVEPEKRALTLAAITTSVVDVEFAIADSATLVVPFNKINSSLPHFLPETVIALVRPAQLLFDHFELFEKLDAESAKNMLLVTGPSRTADIEKILILGAHGPKRLVVIFLENLYR